MRTMATEWWRGAVVYQIYPRSFRDTNGDGIGDLEGIIEKLDYLNDGTPNSLGVDALWLSPVYPSPMHDFGYDISDFRAIDPVFGNMDTFRRLLSEAHRRGIRILMDLVVNHTSHEHAWFAESRSSRDNPKRDWYIWKDPVRGGPPNNWLAFFGGRAWEHSPQTGQYYYHAFLKEQPDLNWRNPEVERAVFDMIRYWLDLGVDGFRLDVVNLYFKDKELRDNPTHTWRLARPFDRQHHVYDRNRPEMHPLLRRFRALVDSYPDRTSVGEVTLEAGEDSAVPAAFQGDDDELHMTFNFAFFFAKWSAREFRRVIEHWEESLRGSSWPTYTLSNHDFRRHISRYARGGDRETENRARVAATMLLTLRGTPFLYYGEEIGMREGHVPRERIVDPVGKRYWPFHPGRDGCRLPMAWDDSEYSGFSDSAPWLPVYARRVRENVGKQTTEPDSLLSLYRALIWLRKKTPALVHGSLEFVDAVPGGVLAYRRVFENQRVLVLLNLENRDRTVPWSEEPKGRVLFSSAREPSAVRVEGAIALLPNEAMILDLG